MTNVLITGASSGFGRLAAQHFAGKGDKVFASMRDPAKGADLEKEGINVIKLDVLDDASVCAAVSEVLENAGSIDVLVNNAGVELHSSVEEADDDEVKWQFDTNVFGLLRVTRAVLPAMRERRAGAIVNVSSLAGVVTAPYGGIYSATKRAVEAIGEALHYELKPFGIRVVLIQPGVFPTNLGQNSREARRFSSSRVYRQHYEDFDSKFRGSPMTQGQDPMDVAKAIYEAAHSDDPGLHQLVGQDATMIGAVRAQSDFEGYEKAMRGALDWWN